MTARAAPPGAMRTLFDVAVRHAFFNDAGETCDDLHARPCAESAALMAATGIVLRNGGGGFTVAVSGDRVPALVARIARDRWTRLVFALTPRTPDLIGVTGLPIATVPADAKLHLSNLVTALPAPGRVMLGGANGATAAMLRPVVGPRLSVPAPKRGTVTLADLSGRVAAAPRTSGGEAIFDTAALPPGLYALTFAKADGTPGNAPRGWRAPTEYLRASETRALALLELVLAQPAAGVGDPLSFPVADDGTITPIRAELRLPARSTVWRYFVVAQNGRLGDDVAVAGADATFSRTPATLPGGQVALLFTADAALPLVRQPPYRFRLTGERHDTDGGRSALDVARLPVAPPAPVWPADTGDPSAGSSEMFVYV